MRLLVVFSLLVTALPAAESALWRFAHPNAKALVGIEWRQLMQSKLGGLSSTPFFQNLKTSGQGMEFAEQVDRILISSPGKRTADPGEQPPFLVAASGRFDLARLRKLAVDQGARVTRYKSAELYLSPKKSQQEPDVAILNPQTILAGDRDSLMRAIDRSAAPAPQSGPLFERASALAERHEIWAVVSSLEQFTAGKLPQSGLPQEIRGLEAGVSLREGLALDLRLESTSEEAARKLASQLAAFQTLATLQQTKGSPNLDFLKRLSITPEPTGVRVALAVNAAELEQGMGQLLASAGRGGGRSLSDWVQPGGPKTQAAWSQPQRQAAPPPPELPPEKRVVRIVGLEEGTREIPFPPQ